MALDFPSSPTVGQKYPQPPVSGQPVYTWDGEKWTTYGGALATGGSPATALPLIDATPAVVGTATKYAREDHVHPTDTSRAPATVADALTPHCGRLAYVSGTALSFLPFNGDRIKINGVIYPIPTTGIVGLTMTGSFVNGVAGQSLANNTTYLVFAFNKGGVIKADFCSGVGHSTSMAVGNVGVEIKSGDATRTLLGIIRVTVAFADQTDARLVRSWFNRQRIATQVNASGSTTSAAFVLCGAITSVVCFAGEAFGVVITGWASAASPCTVSTGVLLDGSFAGNTVNTWIAVNGGGGVCTTYYAHTAIAEGYHTSQAEMASNGSVTANTTTQLMLMVG
jgi:hypothetical protein